MKRLHCGQAQGQFASSCLTMGAADVAQTDSHTAHTHLHTHSDILATAASCCSCRHSQLCLRFFGIFIVAGVAVVAVVGLAKICIGHKCQHPCGIVRQRRLWLQLLLDMNVTVCACVLSVRVRTVPLSKPVLQSACTFVTCLVS